jgi:hypothetical protein
MVKPKTKTQKIKDKIAYGNALKNLFNPMNKFLEGLYDAELDPKWITLGHISSMNDACNAVKQSKTRLNETHVYTDYFKDNNSKFFNVATHIKMYNMKEVLNDNV